jgi:hypothetical protein
MRFNYYTSLLLTVFSLSYSAATAQNSDELTSPKDLVSYWFGMDLIDALLDHKYDYWKDAVSDYISFSWCEQKPDKIGCGKADFEATYSGRLNADLRTRMESGEFIFTEPTEVARGEPGEFGEDKELKMSFEWKYFDEDFDFRSVSFVFYSEKLTEPEWILQSVVIY